MLLVFARYPSASKLNLRAIGFAKRVVLRLQYRLKIYASYHMHICIHVLMMHRAYPIGSSVSSNREFGILTRSFCLWLQPTVTYINKKSFKVSKLQQPISFSCTTIIIK